MQISSLASATLLVSALVLTALPSQAQQMADHAGHGMSDMSGHNMATMSADRPAAAEKLPVQTLGMLQISGAFTRASLPNAPVGGGFLTITNNGDAEDRLVAASVAFADHVEIHEMKMQGDRMQMRPLPEGLPLPAGATVTLAPGGYHLMFMDLSHPLRQGEMVSVTLRFEKAGEITLPFAVLSPAARGPVE